MRRPRPFRPAEDRLVADACARSRTERIRDLVDDTIWREALDLALEAERA